jgi:hypothetical protein
MDRSLQKSDGLEIFKRFQAAQAFVERLAGRGAKGRHTRGLCACAVRAVDRRLGQGLAVHKAPLDLEIPDLVRWGQQQADQRIGGTLKPPAQ